MTKLNERFVKQIAELAEDGATTVNAHGARLINVGTPTSSTDGVSKSYVDTIGGVPGVATLRSTASFITSNNVKLSYHTTVGFGGGDLYWDSSSTETDDNGMIFQVTGVATGRWKRKINGLIDVRSYGALPGATDCTAAIQAAINYVNSDGVSVGAYVPPGIWKIDGMLTLGPSQKLELSQPCTLKRYSTSSSFAAIIWINGTGASLIGSGDASILKTEKLCSSGIIRLGYESFTGQVPARHIVQATVKGLRLDGMQSGGQPSGNPDVGILMVSAQVDDPSYVSYFHRISDITCNLVNHGMWLAGWANGNFINNIYGGAIGTSLIFLNGGLDNQISNLFLNSSADASVVLLQDITMGATTYVSQYNVVSGVGGEPGGSNASTIKAIVPFTGNGNTFQCTVNTNQGCNVTSDFYSNGNSVVSDNHITVNNGTFWGTTKTTTFVNKHEIIPRQDQTPYNYYANWGNHQYWLCTGLTENNSYSVATLTYVSNEIFGGIIEIKGWQQNSQGIQDTAIYGKFAIERGTFGQAATVIPLSPGNNMMAPKVTLTTIDFIVKVTNNGTATSTSAYLDIECSGLGISDTSRITLRTTGVLEAAPTAIVLAGSTLKTLGSLVNVDNVTVLKAWADLRNVGFCNLKCHTVTGYGGGQLYWDAASTETDNNGTIFQVTGITTGRWKRPYQDQINACWFGVVPDATRTVPGTDNTAAMTAAHATGRVVFYPKGMYSFTKFSFIKGGIIGEGRGTQLWCRDTTTDHIITYTGNDETDTMEIDNVVGPIFRDFCLFTPAGNSKAGGAGIRLDPGIAGRPTDCPMVRNAQFNNVMIRYLPIGISISNGTAFTINDCRLHYNAIYGIYEDQPIPTHEDDGDNTISNNSIVGDTTTINVNYRGGGLRMWGNKVLLGVVGVQFSPLRSTSILKCYGNSIEGQSSSCVRFISEAGTAATVFTQVQICDNIITAIGSGSPINVAPTHFPLRDLQINNNEIRTNRTDAANALTVGNTDRFTIVGNLFNGATGAYRAIVTNADALNGKISANLYTAFTYTALCVDATVIEDKLVQTGFETTTTDTAYGTMFRGSETITFPTAFRSAPKVLVCLNGFSNGEIACMASSVTATNFVLTVVSASNGAAPSTNWRAEGLPV